MTTTGTSNAGAIGAYAVNATRRNFPAEVLDAAKMCLVDSIGVAIGAHHEDAAGTVKRVAEGWRSDGKARVFLSGRAAPAAAAMVNATLGHCLDYDDTHVGAVAHLSNPIWATVLALGAQTGATERDMLAAHIAGFEAGARLGGAGLGKSANERGFHSTGVFGCLGATVAAGVLLGLDEERLAHALGCAATQVAGLTASFGTMSKPFHAGKAAFNAVLAAELAGEGFIAATELLEPEGPLASALIQDGAAGMQALDFEDGWELLRNTFKPYASCLLTHPVIDAARSLADAANGREVAEMRIEVNPFCIQLAGKPAPTTGLEGKFSTAYCAALGLAGHRATAQDFIGERLRDETIRRLTASATLVPDQDLPITAARLSLRFADGGDASAETPLALGNPENPMSWDDMRDKFEALVEPVLGAAQTSALFTLLRNFEEPGAMAQLDAMLAGDG